MGEALRVLHVLEPTSAGVPRAVSEAVEAARHNPALEVLTLSNSPELNASAVEPCWRIERTPKGLVGGYLHLSEVAKHGSYDVLHLHSTFAGGVGRLPMRGTAESRLVYQPHAAALDRPNGVGWIARRLEAVSSRATDSVVALSGLEHSKLLAAGVRCKTAIVPNSVDYLTLDRRDEVRSIRTKRGSPALTDPSSLRFVVLGRLASQKGHDRLPRLWPALRNAFPNSRLTIIGDGPLRSELSSAFNGESSVRILGPQANPLPALAESDMLLLPSRWEGYPMVVLEAMTLGLLKVVSNQSLLLSDLHGSGNLADFDDADDVIRAIHRGVATEEGERAAGYKAVEEVFCRRNLQCKIDSLYLGPQEEL